MLRTPLRLFVVAPARRGKILECLAPNWLVPMSVIGTYPALHRVVGLHNLARPVPTCPDVFDRDAFDGEAFDRERHSKAGFSASC
ncbi:MAG: hypothetical protein WB763_15345 [Terriglobia bacterium]|jgi:hypothetical protein